jgi:hypothetical protein
VAGQAASANGGNKGNERKGRFVVNDVYNNKEYGGTCCDHLGYCEVNRTLADMSEATQLAAAQLAALVGT